MSGGTPFGRGEVAHAARRQRRGVTATDADNGTVRWKHRTPAPVLAAVTPTSGGVVFSADMDANAYALNAADGKVLWQTKLDGAAGGGVISYAVDGTQCVVGTNSPIWPVDKRTTRIVVFALASRLDGAFSSIADPRAVTEQDAVSGDAAACSSYRSRRVRKASPCATNSCKRSIDGIAPAAAISSTAPITTTYSDYREVGGMPVPHRYITSSEPAGRTIFQVERVEVGVKFAPDTFTLEPSGASVRNK